VSQMGARQIGGSARIIAAATMAARIAGFARMLVFSWAVGATVVGTAYQSTNTIPNVVFEIAAGGILAAVVVPLLAGRIERGERNESAAIVSALLGWALVVLVPLTILVALLAPWIARALLGPGGDAALGTRMLWVFAPQIVLYGIGIVASGVLNAHRRFTAAALAPLISSLVVIATYLAYAALVARHPDAATWVLAGGTTLGVVALVGTVLPSLRALDLHVRPTLAFPPGVAERARRLGGAGLIALLAQQLSVLGVLWLANHRAGPGSINGYQYVQAVYLLPYAVLAVPLSTAAFPALAATDGMGPAASATLERTSRQIAVLTGLAATVLAATSADLGAFFAAIDAGRDGAGAEALAALPTTMRAFAPGLVGFGLAALLTRALYVRGRPRTASLVMGAGWLLAIVIPLVATTGRPGTATTLRWIGVGSSVGMTIAALGLLVLVRWAWGPQAVARIPRTAGVAVLAGVLAAGWGASAREVFPAAQSATTAVLAGVVAAFVAAVAYGAWMWVLDRGGLRLLIGDRVVPGVDSAAEDAEVERSPGEHSGGERSPGQRSLGQRIRGEHSRGERG
jgi:putative peptidoglycan lipid II flippase